MEGKDGSGMDEQPATHKPHPRESSVNFNFIIEYLTSVDLSGSYTFAPMSQDKFALIHAVGVSHR
jgi:hypothetical protein